MNCRTLEELKAMERWSELDSVLMYKKIKNKIIKLKMFTLNVS